jgi:hypothetical protein
MKKLIAWLKSLFKRKPKSARVIVVNGRSVYIKNDDSFTIENGVVRHKDNAELIVQLYQKVTDGCINQEADNPVCPPRKQKIAGGLPGRRAAFEYG